MPETLEETTQPEIPEATQPEAAEPTTQPEVAEPTQPEVAEETTITGRFNVKLSFERH